MSDTPKKIVFSEPVTPKEVPQDLVPQHWFGLAQQIVSEPEKLDKMTVPNLSQKSERMGEWINGWIKPYVQFGESIDPSNKIGNLKYLSRVIYSEMYQISIPAEGGNKGVMSLGGVITHIDFDENLYSQLTMKNKYTRSLDESYLLFSLNCKKQVDEKIGNELSKTVSNESIERVFNALGIEKSDNPETVESLFKIAWEQLRIEEPEILKTSDEKTLQAYVDKLVEVRSIPEFQFMFLSPFWHEVINATQE